MTIETVLQWSTPELVLRAVAVLVGIELALLLVLLLRRKPLTRFAGTLEMLKERQERVECALREELGRHRGETAIQARQLRDEVGGALKQGNDSLVRTLGELTAVQQRQLEAFGVQLDGLTGRTASGLDALRGSVEAKLTELREDNAAKLERMRATVDEQLHATLEQRLGESFRVVSERLEQVHRGLGEMQALANGVGDLKRVLSNVKVRGTWGEIQLGMLLEQVLSPSQFAANVATRPGGSERVEFAIRLPGRNGNDDCVWLPIDAKFPQEDFQRLLDAHERADLEAETEAGKRLEAQIKSYARAVRDKYLCPPLTTDFGIMYLPTEGLYAEVVRRAGLLETLQREHRVVVAGPTTLAALLNSLQMGFRTLAVEQRSSEVWALLGAVKADFGKFGVVLDKVHKKLGEASSSIETAAQRSRVIERRLRNVQELPGTPPPALLGAEEAGDSSGDDDVAAPSRIVALAQSR
jgi:DNA recombination protein RmuC